jgi:hypothetical protein
VSFFVPAYGIVSLALSGGQYRPSATLAWSRSGLTGRAACLPV